MKNVMVLGLLLFLFSCCAGLKTSVPTDLLTPAAQGPTPSSVPTPRATAAPPFGDTGWRPAGTGLEQRDIELVVGGRTVDHLFLVRIDPADYRFEIAYDARHPKSIEDWQTQLRARIVFNGGFFQVRGGQYYPAGLLVVDGQAFGETYVGYGGMFTVSAGAPGLRWLVSDPYRAGEPLQYALQAFPMLVEPGGVLGFPAEREDNMLARRTMIGRDRAGRFIVLVTSSSYFTLHRLSAYLVASDLDLDVALNLDGGPSSGIALSDPPVVVPAASKLPIVIAVYPR